MRRPIVSKSERSGTGVDMANLSKVVCHGESDKCRFGNPPQESNFQRLGISPRKHESTDCLVVKCLDLGFRHVAAASQVSSTFTISEFNSCSVFACILWIRSGYVLN